MEELERIRRWTDAICNYSYEDTGVLEEEKEKIRRYRSVFNEILKIYEKYNY